ncbi:hypothetical protein RHGRI_026344 [Rhododendron griersonianum]|uniref:Uncharacterized protein n=1 Tax=Rhododendron griersonianum TaxID=479676 RepID=A0AAV6IWX6_9ERIC|nr:hypothetical protein RHGRI_026344 [Rhododendron griersonianum]
MNLQLNDDEDENDIDYDDECEVEKMATCGDGENGKAIERLNLNIWKIGKL